MSPGPALLRLGPLALASRVVLAPMAGVCDGPFKRVIRRLDPHSLLSSEIVNADALLGGDREMRERLRLQPVEHPAALQIAGHTPEALAAAAELAQEAGADVVDFNCGCPSPQLVRRGNGAALLRDPRALPRLLAAVRQACRVPMTVKLRLGWDEPSAGRLIARMAADAGADAVWIHGRTARQKYDGAADWEAIAAIKAELSIPVIGNGDVFSPEVAARRLRESGVDAVAIGRGAMGNPWLLPHAAQLIATGERLSEPTLAERIALLRAHLAELVAEIGPVRGVRESRKHVAWYLTGAPGFEALRPKVNAAPDAEALDAALEGFLEALPDPHVRLDPARKGRLLDVKWQRWG